MQALWMVAASFFFACMGVCVKYAAASHSAMEIVFYRSFLSLLLMFAFVKWRGVPLCTPHWRWHVSRGLLGFAALCVYFWAISILPLATAVTLNYTSAIFLACFLALTGTPLSNGMLGALAVGLAGVVLLLKPTFHPAQLSASLVGLASGGLAALAYCSVRELGTRGEPESRTVFYFAFVSTLCSAAWLLLSEWHPVNLMSAIRLLGVAVFATAAQLAMTRAYFEGHTLMAAALAYSTVVFASLFGMFLWDERYDWSTWLAMGLIALSGVGATYLARPPRSCHAPAP